jgi:hypothetical protein
MSLWERIKANLKQRLCEFVREHIVDDDHHDAREQQDFLGYCSACRGLVRKSDELGYLSSSEVTHKRCIRPNVRVPEGGPPN